MKKIIALLLSLAMVIAIAACGKSEETTAAPTEAPTTLAPTTVAPTEAPTTPAPTTVPPTTQAPTTQAPTTQAPTTQAPTEAPTTQAPARDEAAQEIFDAILQNTVKLLESIADEEGDPVLLTLKGKGAVTITMTMTMGEQKMEIPIKAEGNVGGVLDSEKGSHLQLDYLADLGMLAMLLGDGEEGVMSGKIEMYADMESGKMYEYTDEETGWVYSEMKMEPISLGDITLELDLDDLYSDYNFYSNSDGYLFEGSIRLDGLEEMVETVDSLQDINEMLPLDQLKITLRVKADSEKRLTELAMEVSELTMDMSSLAEGFEASISGLGFNVTIDHDKADYVLPAEVVSSAVDKSSVEKKTDYPWAASKFTLENEVLASTKEFDLSVASVSATQDGTVSVGFVVDNHSDKALSFQVDVTQICGYAVPALAMADTLAGKKDGFVLNIYASNLVDVSPASIDEIRFQVKATEKGNYTGEPYLDKEFIIYPTGLDKDSVVYPERMVSENELPVLENDDVKVIIIDHENDPIYGHSLLVYLENNSDQDLRYRFEDVKINNKEPENPYWGTVLKAGSRGYLRLEILESALKEIDVKSIESVSAMLVVMEDNIFAEAVLCSEGFIYNVR